MCNTFVCAALVLQSLVIFAGKPCGFWSAACERNDELLTKD
jgi:hypothetical protein